MDTAEQSSTVSMCRTLNQTPDQAMNMRTILLAAGRMVSACALLGGCVAVWGGAYHVEADDTSGSAIRFDHVLVSERAIVMHANESCSRYQKVAAVEQERFGVVLPGGSIDEISYSCRAPIDQTTQANPQFPKDRYACMQEALSNVSGAAVVGGFSTSTGFLVPGGGRSFSREEINPTLYRACMTARGYN